MEGDARRGGREARRQGGRPSAIVGDNTRTYNGSRIKQNTGASTKSTGSQRTSAARRAVMPRSSKIGIITLGHGSRVVVVPDCSASRRGDFQLPLHPPVLSHNLSIHQHHSTVATQQERGRDERVGASTLRHVHQEAQIGSWRSVDGRRVIDHPSRPIFAGVGSVAS